MKPVVQLYVWWRKETERESFPFLSTSPSPSPASFLQVLCLWAIHVLRDEGCTCTQPFVRSSVLLRLSPAAVAVAVTVTVVAVVVAAAACTIAIAVAASLTACRFCCKET